MDRTGSADLIAEDDGANKKNVKTKLGAFFSKRVGSVVLTGFTTGIE